MIWPRQKVDSFVQSLDGIALPGAIFLVALIVRVTFMLTFQRDVFFLTKVILDQGMYVALANSLLNGQGFSFSGHPTSYVQPLYPLFLVITFWLFGPSLVTIRLIQAGIGALTCVLIYDMGQVVGKEKMAGIVAGALAVIYPPFLFWTGYVLTETLSLMLVVLMLTFTLRMWDTDNWKLAVISGASLGLATLCRSAIFGMTPFILIWFLMSHTRWRNRLVLKTIPFCLGLIFILMPWTIRNYILVERLSPLASDGSVALIRHIVAPIETGSLGHTYANSEREKDVCEILSHLTASKLRGERERERYNFHLFLQYVSEHPTLVVRQLISNLVYFWTPWPVSGFSASCLHKISMLLTYVWIVPTALVGLWLTIRRDRYATIMIFFLLYWSAVHMVFSPTHRHRLDVMPILIVLAAVVVVRIADFKWTGYKKTKV